MLLTCLKWTFVPLAVWSLQWPRMSIMGHCDRIVIIERLINRIFQKVILSAQEWLNTSASSSLRYIFYRGGLSCVREGQTHTQPPNTSSILCQRPPSLCFGSSAVAHGTYSTGTVCHVSGNNQLTPQPSTFFLTNLHLKSMAFQYPSHNPALAEHVLLTQFLCAYNSYVCCRQIRSDFRSDYQ